MNLLTKNINTEVEFVEICFEKKAKRKASCWEGKLIIAVDKTTKHIIVNYKFHISKCKIDLYTTAAWFEEKNSTKLNLRKELLRKLHLESEHDKRPKSGANRNKLHLLDPEQRKILTDFLNDKTKCTTIKNSIYLIAGNNAGGEKSFSENAPLKTKYHDNWVPFSLLIKALYVGNKYNVPIDKSEWPACPKKGFQQFIDEDDKLKEYFSIFREGKAKSSDYEKIKKRIESELTEYKNHVFSLFFKKVDEKRANFKANIEKHYQISEINKTFNFTWREEWEMAHIFGVSEIRKEMAKFYRQNQLNNVTEYLNFIDNKYNFLPLENCLHKLHDKNDQFAYNIEGKIDKLKIAKKDFDLIHQRAKKHNLHQLPDDKWLNSQRMKFIKLHKEFLKKNPSN